MCGRLYVIFIMFAGLFWAPAGCFSQLVKGHSKMPGRICGNVILDLDLGGLEQDAAGWSMFL